MFPSGGFRFDSVAHLICQPGSSAQLAAHLGFLPLKHVLLVTDAGVLQHGLHLPALRSLTAIAMDAGDADFVLHEGTGMHETLTQLGVKHGWTVYPGDHGNKVPERFGSVVLPFFAAHLKPEAQ